MFNKLECQLKGFHHSIIYKERLRQLEQQGHNESEHILAQMIGTSGPLNDDGIRGLFKDDETIRLQMCEAQYNCEFNMSAPCFNITVIKVV